MRSLEKVTFEGHKVCDKIGLEYLSFTTVFQIFNEVIPFFDLQGITLTIGD